ncbi:hypothetical protein HOD41_08610 [bacterium]|jgi:hypothetical protein|nr:hypothetical protein [bacterium]MBT7311076.1 hypothetical protein [bacterium]
MKLREVHNDELNMTLPWGFRLFSWIEEHPQSTEPYITASQNFHSTSSGDYYIDITFDSNQGCGFMADSEELALKVQFLWNNRPPGWNFITYGEIYIDYFTLEINGVLPTTQTSFGGVKMLFR